MLEGTGEWIRKERLFQAWMEQKAPILWIFGFPGAGKSFLSTYIISLLEEEYPVDPQHPSPVSAGYFYIKDDNQQTRSLVTVLRSISSQIAANNAVYRHYVASFGDSRGKISTADGIWQYLFLDFFTTPRFGQNFAAIVIDGVDEAEREDRRTLLKLLKTLQEISAPNKPAHIQIVLVARPNLRDDITDVWGDDIWQDDEDSINVAGKNAEDISKYILQNIDNILLLRPKKLHPLSAQQALRESIIEKLTDGANGMFMWVKLMIDQIRKKGHPRDIHAALKAAPRELEEMIRQVFIRIANDPDLGAESEKHDLNDILTWVTCAQRPLLMGEMNVLLKIRPKPEEERQEVTTSKEEDAEYEIEVEGMPLLKERLKDSYAALFTLFKPEDGAINDLRSRGVNQPPTETKDDTDEKAPTNDSSSGAVKADEQATEGAQDDENLDPQWQVATIEFSHASIREYLVHDGMTAAPKGLSDFGIGIQLDQAERQIATTCLHILCDEKHRQKFKKYNMIGYAADNFIKHLAKVKRSTLTRPEKTAILHTLFKLFHDVEAIRRWQQSCNLAAFVPLWFGTPTSIQEVQAWFQGATEVESLATEFSEEEQQWMKDAANSAQALFKPMAIELTYQWLREQKDNGLPTPYAAQYKFTVTFLGCYDALVGLSFPWCLIWLI